MTNVARLPVSPFDVTPGRRLRQPRACAWVLPATRARLQALDDGDALLPVALSGFWDVDSEISIYNDYSSGNQPEFFRLAPIDTTGLPIADVFGEDNIDYSDRITLFGEENLQEVSVQELLQVQASAGSPTGVVFKGVILPYGC